MTNMLRMTEEQLAALLKKHKPRVVRILPPDRESEEEMKAKKRDKTSRRCEHCGLWFVPNRVGGTRGKYCSPTCSGKHSIQKVKSPGRPKIHIPVTPSAQVVDGVIYLTLPYPPSVNHYWLLNRNGSRRISDAGLEFRSAVQAVSAGIHCIAGEVAVAITACPPDKRRRDLDNLLKSILDALQHGGLIEDDCNVVDLHIVRGVQKPTGECRVEIRATNGGGNGPKTDQEGRSAILGGLANDSVSALT